MEFPEKNLLVLASAGSGKTFRLSDRVIALMARGVEPERIVALTFTRKAAGEFADAILRKLANAAGDEAKATELAQKLVGGEAVDFPALLEKVVRKLPRITLSTMDAFFTRVVRGFQYELGLTGGKFELLEGEAAEATREELLEGMLDGGLGAGEEEFIAIFRHATSDREGTQVLEELRKFIAGWHAHFLSPDGQGKEWGPAGLAGVEVADWEKRKGALVDVFLRDAPGIVTTDKRQAKAIAGMIEALGAHTIGSGSLEGATSLLKSVLAAAAEGEGSLEVSYFKPFTITGLAAQALRDLVELAARCELAAALSRTRGVRGVVSAYDGLVEGKLRSMGKLGFDDVKRLMGAWMSGEDARLRREAVDFRLGARYNHWLLDEFQDTSRDEWRALLPLIDEGITDDDSTVFVVGDRKQAIYAWRGGEVGLFDELIRHYGMKPEAMAESWRSCPEVLEPVNRVFGDSETMIRLFGEEAAAAWVWEEHVSAEPLRDPARAGHASVEIVEKDSKAERVIELLHSLGVGKRRISCGVLVDTNKHVRELADELREAGFQVVEEGAREPGKDHPVGVLVWQALRWLADPADSYARLTVMMSPLGPELATRFGGEWQLAWETLGGRAAEVGFSGMVGELLADLRGSLGGFGKRRAEDLLEALGELDRRGVISAREAADWIGRMKISQSPGVAAVQVMTVHKSKGLGFDAVILPDIPSGKIPNLQHYKTVSGDGWLTAAPAKWARAMIPELREPEERWCRRQTYEEFCQLYVAMTRAKRGLYILLDPPPKNPEEDKASLPNWIMASLGIDSADNTVFESGCAGWTDGIAPLEPASRPTAPRLGKAIPKRPRGTPSGAKTHGQVAGPGSGEGRRFGTAIHAAFEKIGWIDGGQLPEFPAELRKTMELALAVPEIRALLSKGGRRIDLHLEQRIEAVMNGKWLSGVIDRLHIHRDAGGSATRVEIIDFKTDRVDSPEELTTRYAGQMDAYRRAMQAIHPQAEVICILVSTALMSVVECE